MRRTLAVIVLLAVSASASWGQSAPVRHFTFKMGAGYDQGTFGSTEVSRAAYAPFSLRYTGKWAEVGVSTAFVRIDTAGGVRLIDGVPTQTDSSNGPLQESGIGDTTLRTRFFLVNDEGRESAKPSVTPFVKVKLPTADESRGLGTGKVDYGFGVELDKIVGPIFLFGDLGYTVMGKIPTLPFRNRPAASFGIGKQIGESVTVSSMVDWRRSIIAGNPNPTELVGMLSYRASRTVTITPNAFVGLSSGSSDFGVGMQLGFKF
jgi:hypothetical protein